MNHETRGRQRLLDIDGHALAVLSANEHCSGTPVVFLHGITASIGFWVPSLPPAVREGIHWISLSLPGHPPSRLPPRYRPENITAEMFAEVALAALSYVVGDRPAALVGWSTGGFTALNIAARHPERVTSVFSISGFALGRWYGLAGLMQGLSGGGRLGKRAFQTIFRVLARHQGLFELIMGQGSVNRRAFRESSVSRATLDLWHDTLRRQNLTVLADLFEGIGRFDIGDLISRITAPTLVAGGDRDPYIPLAHTRFIAERIPGAELIVLERTGHMFFADCPRYYHWLLSDWLNRTAGYALPLEPVASFSESSDLGNGNHQAEATTSSTST